jgi:hypothetical protein
VGRNRISSTITDAIVMALRHDLAIAGVMAHAPRNRAGRAARAAGVLKADAF